MLTITSGGKALIEALKMENTKVIFGFPGGNIITVYNDLVDSGIRHILVRHEQCAAHMADGYARVSGQVGVCMATSGPGASNLVSGIATAYMDSSPIVAITGQTARELIGKDAFQEIDIMGVTAGIVKHNYIIENPEDIPSIVKAAFCIANSGRKGPVLIDIPRDIQTLNADFQFIHQLNLPNKAAYKTFTEQEIEETIKSLKDAERPLIFAGGGVVSSNSSEELLGLAELVGAPIVTSLMGKGCISEDHPLVLGMIGMHGLPPANRAVDESDVILAVGCRFAERSLIGVNFDGNKKVIHLDIDAAEIGKNVHVTIPLIGDAKQILGILLNKFKNISNLEKNKSWLDHTAKLKQSFILPEFREEDPIKPPRLMKELRDLLPKDAIITTEVGQNQMWTAIYFKAYLPRTFISSGGLGTMGFGFPAALGAKMAKFDAPVIAIAGDGSFLMNEHELATSVEENIPVVVIILDNRALGMVAQWQRTLYRRYSQVHLGNIPDFVKLAEAYGAHGLRVESYGEFRKAVREALRNTVTTVIDVPIPSEENVEPIKLPKGLSVPAG